MTLELRSKDVSSKWKSVGLFFLTILLFTGALYYRRADAFTNPQFWAEDGMVFFMEQEFADAFIPFRNYNGYIHFLPRCVSYFVKVCAIPYELVPTCYNYITYLFYLGYFALLWKFIPTNPFTRLCMIVGLGILPVTPEVYMNLTNLQWFSAFGLIILLFKFESGSIKRTIFLSVFAGFAAITGPFSVILTPLLLYRGWINRKKITNLIPILVALLGAGIQLVFMLNHPTPRPAPPLPIPSQHLFITIYNSIKQIFFLNETPILALRTKHYLVLIPTFVMLIIFFLRDLFKKKEARIMLWLSFFSLGLTTLYIHWPYEWMMSPFGMGARYYFILLSILWWLILLSIRRFKIIQGCILLGLVVLFVVKSIHTRTTFIDFNWKAEARQYEETGEILAPINPPGMFILFPEKKLKK